MTLQKPAITALAVSAICGAIGTRKNRDQLTARPSLTPFGCRKNGTIKIDAETATYAARFSAAMKPMTRLSADGIVS